MQTVGKLRTYVVGVCLILGIRLHGQIDLEAEHEGVDPNVEHDEQEQPPLLIEETPSRFLVLQETMLGGGGCGML